MTAVETSLLQERISKFDEFYEALIPALVNFVQRLGISPAHEVLNRASDYTEMVGKALEVMKVENGDDRIWLITRLGYFIGEYFSQSLNGCWFVNDIENSRYYTRYVVGRFNSPVRQYAMIDPFEIAQTYVDSQPPRNLLNLLMQVNGELLHG